MLELRLFGSFEAVDGDRGLALGGAKQRAVLAVLAIRRGEVVSADRLIDSIWGKSPPATAAKTLQVYVSHLRKALGPDVLVTRGGGYVLELGSDQLDRDRFEARVAEGRRALADGDAAGARGSSARRSRFGAAHRLPTSPTRPLPKPRSRGWRRFISARSKTAWTPSWLSAITAASRAS